MRRYTTYKHHCWHGASLMRVCHWSQNHTNYPKNQQNSSIFRIFAFKLQQMIGIRKMKYEMISLENVQIADCCHDQGNCILQGT